MPRGVSQRAAAPRRLDVNSLFVSARFSRWALTLGGISSWKAKNNAVENDRKYAISVNV